MEFSKVFTIGFILIELFLAGTIIWGINYESIQRTENKNDERWRLVLAKSDRLALNTFYIIAMLAAFITILSQTLNSFSLVELLFSKEVLFSFYEYYTLLSLTVVFSARTFAVKYYNKRI